MYCLALKREKLGIYINGVNKQCTAGQNQVIFRHLIIYYPTSEGVGKVSERMNERSGAS